MSTYAKFLGIWNYILIGLTLISIITAILLFIIHKVRITSIKDYKKKYDYLSTMDTKMILYIISAFALALGFFINTVYTETVVLSWIWFFIRIFISICVSVLIIYISLLMLKFAYPATLNKKLRKWRYKPRINERNGRIMKLLSEEEEDVHLDEGMQAEENVFSVDYDVWVDEKTGDVKIEKYPGHLQALKCNSCGFQTMKLVKEEILVAPTATTQGEILKNYQCSYCASKRSRTVRIAKLSETEATYKLPEDVHFRGESEKVDLVSIEIHLSGGKTNLYEFSSTRQASEFLKEFAVEENE